MTFLLSPLARGLAVLAVLSGSFFFWLLEHDKRVEDRVTVKIEKKANEDVKTADDVRDAVAAGGRGMRSKYVRPGE